MQKKKSVWFSAFCFRTLKNLISLINLGLQHLAFTTPNRTSFFYACFPWASSVGKPSYRSSVNTARRIILLLYCWRFNLSIIYFYCFICIRNGKWASFWIYIPPYLEHFLRICYWKWEVYYIKRSEFLRFFKFVATHNFK